MKQPIHFIETCETHGLPIKGEVALAPEGVLHCCCAPCSSAILEWMLNNGVRPVLYFCNPNILLGFFYKF